MIERIKVRLRSWFAPVRYVAYIVKAAMENVERVQGGASDEV